MRTAASMWVMPPSSRISFLQQSWSVIVACGCGTRAEAHGLEAPWLIDQDLRLGKQRREGKSLTLSSYYASRHRSSRRGSACYCLVSFILNTPTYKLSACLGV